MPREYDLDFGFEPEFDNIPELLREGKFCVWKASPKANGKVDKIPFNKKGMLSTTKPADWLSFDEARALYEKGGYNGIGRACERDGLVFFDLDGTKEIPEEIQKLGETYHELSPSGNGLRIVYQSETPPAQDLASPYEIYSGNSPRFVTITGATDHPLPINKKNGQIQDLIDTHLKSSMSVESNPFAGLQKPDFSEKELVAMLKTLDPDMGHDGWLKVMMAVHHFYDGAERGRVLVDKWSRASKDYDAREIQNRYRSLGREHKAGMPQITAATVKKMAKEAGYNPQVLIDEEAKAPSKKTKAKIKSIFQPMSSEVLDNQPHHVSWLIKGLVERRSVGVLIGAPGVGKSFAAIDIACCVASEQSFHGRKTRSGRVLFLAGEGFSGIKRRVQAWRQEHGNPDLSPLIVSERAINFGSLDDLKLLYSYLESEEPFELIVIDTLARATAGMSENDAQEMGPFMERLAGFTRKYDSTVLAVHHTGKNNTQEGRGSSAIKGAVDFELLMTKPVAGSLLMSCNKMKEAEEFDPVGFKLIQTQLPANFNDEDGEPTTSAFLRMDTGVASDAESDQRLTKAMRLVMRAYEACMDDPGVEKADCPVELVARLGMDAPSQGIKVTDIKDRYKRMNADLNENPSTQRSNLKRGLDDLKAKGFFDELDGVMIRL
jgi:hypothetical protein